jgi:predicted transcriptional regulator
MPKSRSPRVTANFRLAADGLARLDAIATGTDRDRSDVLRLAVAHYLAGRTATCQPRHRGQAVTGTDGRDRCGDCGDLL